MNGMRSCCSRHPFTSGYGRKCCVALLLCSVFISYAFLPETYRCAQICPDRTTLTHNRLTFNRSAFVEHFSEFVCPQNFRNLADWVYGWPEGVFEEQIKASTNASHIAPCLPDGSILFVKSDYLQPFFHNLYPNLTYKFVLISGQGDAPASSTYLSYLHRADSKIIHWFGQNTDMRATASEKFTPIPLGINCYEMANGIRYVYAQVPNRTLPSIYGGADEPRQYTHPLDITHRALSEGFNNRSLLLLNFDLGTDPTRLRVNVSSSLCNQSSTATFITCIIKPGGVHINKLPAIYTRNRHFPFWLSPRGNGLDCHRTWEALYLDAIPIVWNTTLHPLYVDLPVIVINDWKELTEPFLRIQLQEIATNKLKKPPVYRFDKLRFSFWRRLILEKSRHALTEYERKYVCWHARKG